MLFRATGTFGREHGAFLALALVQALHPHSFNNRDVSASTVVLVWDSWAGATSSLILG